MQFPRPTTFHCWKWNVDKTSKIQRTHRFRLACIAWTEGDPEADNLWFPHWQRQVSINASWFATLLETRASEEFVENQSLFIVWEKQIVSWKAQTHSNQSREGIWSCGPLPSAILCASLGCLTCLKTSYLNMHPPRPRLSKDAVIDSVCNCAESADDTVKNPVKILAAPFTSRDIQIVS